MLHAEAQMIQVKACNSASSFNNASHTVNMLQCAQGTEKLFQLGLLFNTAEAEHFQQKQKGAAQRLPVKLPSTCKLNCSSDDENDGHDIFK